MPVPHFYRMRCYYQSTQTLKSPSKIRRTNPIDPTLAKAEQLIADFPRIIRSIVDRQRRSLATRSGQLGPGPKPHAHNVDNIRPVRGPCMRNYDDVRAQIVKGNSELRYLKIIGLVKIRLVG